MADDDDNVIHFAPRADAQDDAEKNHVANPLNLRRELQRNALTKGLVGFDEFASRSSCSGRSRGRTSRRRRRFEPRAWTDGDDTALAEHFNSRGFKRVGRNLVRDVIELEARRTRSIRCAIISRPSMGRHAAPVALPASNTAAPPSTATTLEERTDAATYIAGGHARLLHLGGGAHLQAGLQGRLHADPRGRAGRAEVAPAAQARRARRVVLRLACRTTSPRRMLASTSPAIGSSRWARSRNSAAPRSRPSSPTSRASSTSTGRPMAARMSPRRGSAFSSARTNANAYLHDPTGNRRFWPVKVGTIRLAKVGTIVSQLWAEAVDAYRKGEPWWLSSKHERLAAREQQGRLELDPWHDRIADYVALWDGRRIHHGGDPRRPRRGASSPRPCARDARRQRAARARLRAAASTARRGRPAALRLLPARRRRWGRKGNAAERGDESEETG